MYVKCNSNIIIIIYNIIDSIITKLMFKHFYIKYSQRIPKKWL